MPKRTDFHKVLIIGSGPIVIGQACEFDYSGTQACKALRKLGYEIVLVDMSLVGSKLKQEPFRYFAERGYIIYHFILYASIDILKLRIEGDENRDQQYALAWVNNQEELLSDCGNSYIIDTTELNPDDAAKEIASIVFG